MKPTQLAFVAALVMGAAFSGRALWQTAHPPAPAAAYAALFETHCLSRLATVQSGGADPHADLPKNAQRITRLDAAGLQAIQKRTSCAVKDATRLMTEAQRNAVAQAITALIAQKLPALSEATAPYPADLARIFTTDAPEDSPNHWGITLTRSQPASGDTKQMTVTQLTLPRG